MRRVLGNSIFWLPLFLSIIIIAATPTLMLGLVVVMVGDERLGNQPRYIQILTFLRPHLCLALPWSRC
jgi:hypothetical protein